MCIRDSAESEAGASQAESSGVGDLGARGGRCVVHHRAYAGKSYRPVVNPLAPDRLTLLSARYLFPYNAASSSICANKSSSAACTAAAIGSWSDAVIHRTREPMRSCWTT